MHSVPFLINTRIVSVHFRSGLSYYYTQFMKEEFSYQRPGQNQQDQILFIHPYENQSELTHWYVEADLIRYRPSDSSRRPNSSLSVYFSSLENLQSGLAVHGYSSGYLEKSLNGSRYYQDSTPLLLEGYLDSQWKFDTSPL